MRDTFFWQNVRYARQTGATCFASAAASAVAIAEVQAGANSEGKGLARSAVTDILLLRAGGGATSTKAGVTCL